MVLQEDNITLILQAEREYRRTMRSADKRAEAYMDDSKKKQNAYFEDLKREWYLFAKAESEKYMKMLYEDEKRIEADIGKAKERLTLCKDKKAELISERIKEEVLCLYGNSQDGKTCANL